jgi:hypothetical protein
MHFACFIDFNKAFDNVDYWLLASKRINSVNTEVQLCCLRLITFWYSNQSMHVCWQNMISESFRIYNGVRQGA